MKQLSDSITNKLYNELETNLYNALYWSSRPDAYTVLNSRLDNRLLIELNRKLNETVDNNLFDELNETISR
jgi:hypothetical protein